MKILTSFFALAALACAVSAFAEDAFTPDELRALHATRAIVEKQCQAGIDQLRQSGALAPPGAPPGVSQSLESLVVFPEYCGCVGDTFEKGVTPALWRGGSEQEGAAMIKRVTVQCALGNFKAKFPGFCTGMVSGALFDRQRPGQDADTVRSTCACAQEDIDALSPDNFDAYTQATRRDYAEYRRSLAPPTPGHDSILGTLARCGVTRPAQP